MKSKIMRGIFLTLLLGSNVGESKLSFQSQGEVSLESTYFNKDDNPSTIQRRLSGFARLETSAAAESAAAIFKFRGFARADQYDQGRDLLALEELWLKPQWSNANLSLQAGYQLFNWTALELFHPADIINSRNFDSDLDALEKFGELTLSLEQKMGTGILALYYFPWFKSPHFPSTKSRLGGGTHITDARWVEENGDVVLSSSERHPRYVQWGARFTQSIGQTDFDFHYIRHIDRNQPLLAVDVVNSTLIPYFLPLQQYGGTLQSDLGQGFLFKFEGEIRKFAQEQKKFLTLRGPRGIYSHKVAAVGVEKMWSTVGGADVSVLLEAQEILGLGKVQRSEISLFQRDLLLGTRYSLNDISGKEFFAGIVTDLERSHEYLYLLRYSQRLNDEWQIKLTTHIVDAPIKNPQQKTILGTPMPENLELYHKAHQLGVYLTRFF